MKFPLPSIFAIFALSLSACHADPAPTQAPAVEQASMPKLTAPTEPSHARTSQADPTTLLSGKLHNGMAYNELRKIALNRGWQPKPDARCMANVVGGNYQKLCSAHPELSDCRVCQEVPELSSCSADGHCLMQFSHENSDKTLQVGTYGEIGDWNASANQSKLSVTGWEYTAPVSH